MSGLCIVAEVDEVANVVDGGRQWKHCLPEVKTIAAQHMNKHTNCVITYSPEILQDTRQITTTTSLQIHPQCKYIPNENVKQQRITAGLGLYRKTCPGKPSKLSANWRKI